MPIQFSSVPLAQLRKASTGKKIKPTSSSSTKSPTLQRQRTTVTVAAYGAKLFEPIMSRERPISVHFLDFILQDSESITRFSEDGFFAIKFFLRERRCYLLYFINPINPTRETTLETACQEAIDFQTFEFHDKDEYVTATTQKTREGLYSHPNDVVRLRKLSALGQTEEKIISILRDRVAAEKFLKRQREYQQQDKDWRSELARIEKEKEEEEVIEAINNVIEEVIEIKTDGVVEIVEETTKLETPSKFVWGKK